MANLNKSAEYARKYETSPIFRQRNTVAIAANAYFTYNWEISEPVGAAKYLPFNLMIVTNNDTANALELYVNGDVLPIKYIPAGVMLTIDQNSLPAFTSFTLKNIGTSEIAIGSVEVVAQREAISSDQIMRQMHKRLFLEGKVF